MGFFSGNGGKTPLTIRNRLAGGTRCSHCRETFHKDSGWPTRYGLICPGCKNTWNAISDLC